MNLIDQLIRVIAAHYSVTDRYVYDMIRACGSIDEAIVRIHTRESNSGDDIDIMSDCHLK